MSTPTDSHPCWAAESGTGAIARAAGIWPPPATPAADVVDADYGTMNRELLAEKLAATWMGRGVNWHEFRPDTRANWLRVVDVAISELQGTPES